jgi:hypothetical protein
MASIDKKLLNDYLAGNILHTSSGSTYDEVSSTNPLPVAVMDGLIVERTVHTSATKIASGGTYTIGPTAMEGYGTITVLVFAERAGAFTLTGQETSGTSLGATTLVNAAATVAGTWYHGTAVECEWPYYKLVWTNGVLGTSAITVVIIKEGSVGADEMTLVTSTGTYIGTTADPLPIALTGATAELLGETTALHVELTDGTGTAVSQGVDIQYADVTRWETAALDVGEGATATGTARDCDNLPYICVTMHSTKASTVDGCKVQESEDNSTWYDLFVCTIGASTYTSLFKGCHSRRYVRTLFINSDVSLHATLNVSISGSPV